MPSKRGQKGSPNIHIKALEQALSARYGWQANGAWRDDLIAAVKRKSEKLGFDETAYCRMATASAGELEVLAEMAINGETRFFREPDQFEALRESVLPELIRLRSKDKKIEAWSAACSTGEEAYSLAILLAELLPEEENWKKKVLATDMRAQAILSASQGRYPSSSIRAIPKEIRNAYFVKSDMSGRERLYEVNPEVKNSISFRRANLYDLKFWKNLHQQFDLILCNNLLVYFHKLAVRQTLDNLAAALKPGGLLMVMKNEAGYIHHPKFRLDSSLPGAFFRRV